MSGQPKIIGMVGGMSWDSTAETPARASTSRPITWR